jgi:hypothetical protein
LTSRLGLLFFGREAVKGRPLYAWPRYDFDPAQEVTRIVQEEVRELSRALPGKVAFTESLWVKGVAEVEKALKMDVDGYLAYILTTNIDYRHLYRVVERGLPTLAYTRPYHSLPWPELATLTGRGLPLLTIASSRLEELALGLRVLHGFIQVRKARILVVSTPDEMSLERLHTTLPLYLGDQEKDLDRMEALLNLEFADYRELLQEAEAVGVEEAERVADELIGGASELGEGVRLSGVVEGARLYLAAKRLLSRYQANALAINDITIMLKDPEALAATPCVLVSLLNDEGVPTACEADLNSLILMVFFRHALDKPSVIAEPVFDLGTNRVVYAHCTAARRLGGLEEAGEPYALELHGESGLPVTVRTRMSEGQLVTVANISSDFRRLMAFRAPVRGTPVTEHGCRMKVELEVDDPAAMLWFYTKPLHRVLVYGDHLKLLRMLAVLMGLQFTPEGQRPVATASGR